MNIRYFYNIKLNGDSNLYIILILGMVCVLSYFLSGGLLPDLEREIIDPKIVKVSQNVISEEKYSLQLVNMQIEPKDSFGSREECLSKTGIYLLIDQSSSLDYNKATDDLKTAITTFLPDIEAPNLLIGLYTFASSAKEIIPLGAFKDNRDRIISEVNKMDPFGDTRMKDGFILVRDLMKKNIQQYPDYNFYVVFFSDGSPDPLDQDPIDIANEVKSSPLNSIIFSVALDKADNQIMREAASDPKDTYFIESPTAQDLQSAFNSIGQRICS